MSELTEFIYVFITLATIWLGLRVYGRWTNHISIYGVVWGTQIILYEVRLIDYYPVSTEAKVFVFGSWLVFVVASLTFRNHYRSDSPVRSASPPRNDVFLFVFLSVLLVGAVGIFQHWMVVLKIFGSIKSVIINGNLLYSLRKKETGIPGEWHYIDAFNLAADFLGGYFAATRRRPIILSVVPLMLEVINGIGASGRSRIVIGLVLWGTAYFLSNPKSRVIDTRKAAKRMALVGVVIVIFAVGMEAVREIRHGNESFSGETEQLSQLRGLAFVTPSVYMYLSSDLPVLSKFLDYEFAGRIEHDPVGGNTFAPFYNIFAKFGLAKEIPGYEKFYSVHLSTNTGTYLRELYADWGIFGAMLGVYLLGAISSIVFELYQRKKSLVALAVLANVYVVVFFTFALQATRWGYWVISLVVSVISAAVIDKYCSVTTDPNRGPASGEGARPVKGQM